MGYEIDRIYGLERTILDISAETEKMKKALAQGEYDLRSAKAALLEYEGSLRSFLDKLKGTREDRLEQLRRSLTHAEAALTQQRNRQEVLRRDLLQAQSERAGYPLLSELPDCREKAAQEARLCIHVVEPMLEAVQQAILDCRDLEQGRRVGELISPAERQEILSGPIVLGMECGTWLERLERALSGMDMPFVIPEFYRNPALYLAATNFTHRDRRNGALDQTLQLKKQLAQMKINTEQ